MSHERPPAWLVALLRCPVHGTPLVRERDTLTCEGGDRYPIHDGIAVLLRDDVRQTHPAAAASIETARRDGAVTHGTKKPSIDPYVQQALLATNGYMYRPLLGRLTAYPIPELRIAPEAGGTRLLDIGCNWGRWCVAASRRGFQPVGIDPSLEAVQAAYRVSDQLGAGAHFVVADGRYLPFAPASFDVVFSYSVWQHFARTDTKAALSATARVLKPGGRAFVQMAGRYGLRSLYHQARRGFRAPRQFEVRYWGPHELVRAFEAEIGPTELSVDGYFSLNPQAADRRLLPRRFRWVVAASDLLRRASQRVGWLKYAADSFYMSALKSDAPGRTR